MAQLDEEEDRFEGEVDRVVNLLLDETYRVAGGPIEDNVRAWWVNQYRAKFFYAMRRKRKDYATDQQGLRMKAVQLGEVARRIAGPGKAIDRETAALASLEIDCPPGSDPQIAQDWCN